MTEFLLESRVQLYQEDTPPLTCFTDGTEQTIPFFNNQINLSVDHVLVISPNTKHLTLICDWLKSYKYRKPSKYEKLHLVAAVTENKNCRYQTLTARLYYKLNCNPFSCAGNSYRVELYSEKDKYYQSAQWHLLAERIKKRDGYKCVICNNDWSLYTHHRTYERFGDELPEDLTTLCSKCHSLFHSKSKIDGPVIKSIFEMQKGDFKCQAKES